MSNEIAIHSDDLYTYRTIVARVAHHPIEDGNSFTVLHMRLDNMRVSIYMHAGDLLDFAGALERAAEQLRETAELHETKLRADVVARLRSSLLEDVTA